jgi:hypothetical protein
MMIECAPSGTCPSVSFSKTVGSCDSGIQSRVAGLMPILSSAYWSLNLSGFINKILVCRRRSCSRAVVRCDSRVRFGAVVAPVKLLVLAERIVTVVVRRRRLIDRMRGVWGTDPSLLCPRAYRYAFCAWVSHGYHGLCPLEGRK